MTSWLTELLEPTTPGMDNTTLRARPLPFAAILLGIVALAICRYFLGILDSSGDQALTVGLGISWALLVLAIAHGPAALRAVEPAAWRTLGFGLVLYVVFWHFGRMDAFEAWVGPLIGMPDSKLAAWVWFTTCNGLMLLLPALGLASLIDGRSAADLGLFAPYNKHRPWKRPIWPAYLIGFVAVLPLVGLAASDPDFTRTYPLWAPLVGRDGAMTWMELLTTELLYVLSFVALEGFFRGYLSFGMERGFGLYALALAAIPYTTGHFGKPMPEAMGAIAAGCALGFLALKHRSVWLGVILHVGIAWAMDAVAVVKRGLELTW